MNLRLRVMQFGAVLLLTTASVAWCQEAVTNIGEPNAAYPALFLAEGRPVFMRIRVRIDQTPLEQRWQAFAERTFKTLDQDADERLSSTEQASLQRPTGNATADSVASRFFGALTKGLSGGRTASSSSPTPEQGIDLEQFLTSFARQKPSINATEQDAPASFAADDRLLWQRVDLNQDDALSWDELQNLPQTLGRLDANGDELVSRAELSQFRNPLQQTSGVTHTLIQREFLTLTHREEAATAVERMLAMYLPQSADDPANRDTRPGDMKISDAVFAAADLNGDAVIRPDEWLEFLLDPLAEFTWNVDLVVGAKPASAPGQPSPVPVASSAGGLTWSRAGEYGIEDVHVNVEGPQSAVIVVGGSKLRLGLGSASTNIESLFIDQFSAADTDDNEYIDRTESQRHGYFANTFPMLDLDRDGKLFLDELKQFMARLDDELSNRVEVQVLDHGREWFMLWDQNDDGRLSARELRIAETEFQQWDRSADGRVQREEVPRVHTVLFARPRPQVGLSFLDASPTAVLAHAQGEPLTAPPWFARMDRNGDGDLSPREYLAPVARFRQMDHNRDGLISLAEALATPSPQPAGQP